MDCFASLATTAIIFFNSAKAGRAGQSRGFRANLFRQTIIKAQHFLQGALTARVFARCLTVIASEAKQSTLPARETWIASLRSQ